MAELYSFNVVRDDRKRRSQLHIAKVLNLSPFSCTLQFAYARELLNNTVPEISY